MHSAPYIFEQLVLVCTTGVQYIRTYIHIFLYVCALITVYLYVCVLHVHLSKLQFYKSQKCVLMNVRTNCPPNLRARNWEMSNPHCVIP